MKSSPKRKNGQVDRRRINKRDYFLVGNPADPQGLTQMMVKHVEWLKVKNYSMETINHRVFQISNFIDWCDKRALARPGDITKPILERYQRHLFYYRKSNGKPLSTLARYGAGVCLRAWFKWMAKQNHILYNPASDLELPKLEKRLPKVILSEREAELVLNQPDITTALGIRDRAILEVFYSCGIRRMELLKLNLHAVDADRGTLTVRQGKGRKDRVIPIGERAISWVEKYKYDVRPELLCDVDEDHLFLSRFGGPFEPHGLTKLVRDYINAAKINKSGSCHVFRHTMATHMLDNGADVRYIQAMLGHVKLETTQLYTQVSIKRLKEVHTLTHPAKDHRTVNVGFDINDEPEPSRDEVLYALDMERDDELD